MQSATEITVAVSERIGRLISESKEVAGSIAAAVEERSRHLRDLTQHPGSLARHLRVSQAASEGGAAANQVLASARQLAETGERLKSGVIDFLARVRAA